MHDWWHWWRNRITQAIPQHEHCPCTNTRRDHRRANLSHRDCKLPAPRNGDVVLIVNVDRGHSHRTCASRVRCPRHAAGTARLRRSAHAGCRENRGRTPADNTQHVTFRVRAMRSANLPARSCATPRPVTPGRLGRPDDEDVNLDGYGLCALVAVIVQYIFHTVQYSEYIQW